MSPTIEAEDAGGRVGLDIVRELAEDEGNIYVLVRQYSSGWNELRIPDISQSLL